MLLICFWTLLASSITYAAPFSTGVTSDTVSCSDQGDCITVSTDCTDQCGCDKLYIYDAKTNECTLNIEYLKAELVEKYNTEETIRNNAERVFSGIIVSVILFVSCASLCAITACIYCCHVNYTDLKLNKDVQALAQKLNRDGKLKKPEQKKTQPIAESCNVVVEDAGVFVC